MKDLPLNNKKVLFLSPKFFGYEKEIFSEMEEMGAKVSFRSHLPSEHPWIKTLFRICPKFAWFFSDIFFFSWLKNNNRQQFDLILIIKGEGLSPKFIESLRKTYSNAHMVLYLWDSTLNCKHVEQKYPYFDEVFSFDPVDCGRIKGFKYRPLFFLNKYLGEANSASGHVLFFLVTLNGDRPKVICRLIDSLKQDIIFDYWLFVRSKVELALRKLVDPYLRKIGSDRLLFIPMPAETTILHLKNCAAVLDIEHPQQNGLTMRTFEVIASGKKLITTNKLIKNHDFYDPSRICLIDRKHPLVSLDFFNIPFDPLYSHFVPKYSLRGWILEVLGLKKEI
jgi:hypothetical protein